MNAWLSALSRQPRRPLAGIAVGAIVGILLGEVLWRLIGAGARPAAVDVALGLAGTLFLLAVAGFVWRPRTWLCWTLVIGGFATLHLFQCDVVPAMILARELTSASGGPSARQIIQATGSIIDEPRASAKVSPAEGQPGPQAGGADWRFTFRLDSIAVAGRQWQSHAEVAAFWQGAARQPVNGDQLTVIGLANNVAGSRNPGEFDYAAYLRRRGIASELTMNGIADVLAAEASHGWSIPILGVAAQRVHDAMDRTLRLDLQDSPDVSLLVTSILLGLRDNGGLGDLEALFQRTGTLHFFAIDGLKLGFLGWLLLAALTSGGLPRKWARLLCLLLLLGYTLAAGVGPASVRAVAVAAVLLGGEWLDRPVRAGNSLGAAAAALLLFDTNQLFLLGFQLSFLVVLAILTLGPWVRERLWRIGAPDPFLPRLLYPWWLRGREAGRRALVDLTSVAVAAWVGSLPVMFLVFHLVSPISIFANVAVFPLAAAMFGLAASAALGGVLWPNWAIWMNNANWLVAKTLLAALHLFDAVPGGSFHVASPEFWRWRTPAAEMTVLDAGPARAIALRAGGAAWLLDAGRATEYQRIVLPFEQARGVDRLDTLLLTAGEAYHLAGAPLAMADLRPARVILSALPSRSPSWREVQALLAARRLPPVTAQAGATFDLGRRSSLRVLFPPPDWHGAAATRTVIARFDAAGWRVLLLGDSTAEARRWLTAHQPGAELRSDVVILGAAGEGPADVKTFLAAVQPRLLICQRGRAGGAVENLAGSWTTVKQEDAGAVTLRFYPDHLEADEFLSGKRRLFPSAP